MKFPLLAATSLCLFGCASYTYDDYTVIQTFEEPVSVGDVPITQLATFLSDNQKALILSEPIIEQSKLAKSLTSSAHRSPPQEEFSLKIMEYILDDDKSGLIIHGGDAINNSCLDEFNQFATAMTKSKKEWYLSPGNHDGFYLGISSPESWRNRGYTVNSLLDERIGWANACTPIVKANKNKGKARNEFILDKFSFIQKYTDTLGLKAICSNNPTACSEDKTYGKKLSVYCIDEPQDLTGKALSKVCWTSKSGDISIGHNSFVGDSLNLQIEQAWQSFIVQLLTVPFGSETINILLVDTAAYSGDNNAVNRFGELKAKGYGAADNAEIVTKQQKIIKTWVLELNSQGKGIDLIVGHHPLEDLDSRSFEFLSTLLEQTSSRIYMSGDTHDGFDVWYIDQNGSKSFRQANIGSTIDAPLEYALIGVNESDLITVERFSMTPLENNGRVLKSKHYGLKKNYATMDRLWEKCKDFHYEPNALIDESLRAKQAASYLGISYLFPGSTTRASYYAYKINRLIDTVNLYNAMYIHLGVDVPSDLKIEKYGYNGNKTLIEQALESLNKIDRMWFNGLLDEKELRQTLLNLSSVIDVYQEHELSSKPASEFKQCTSIKAAQES